jgi:hypothetical protein
VIMADEPPVHPAYHTAYLEVTEEDKGRRVNLITAFFDDEQDLAAHESSGFLWLVRFLANLQPNDRLRDNRGWIIGRVTVRRAIPGLPETQPEYYSNRLMLLSFPRCEEEPQRLDFGSPVSRATTEAGMSCVSR